MKKHKNGKRCQFDGIVRIRKSQIEWLKENKDTKTIAGFLDKIINEYKKCETNRQNNNHK